MSQLAVAKTTGIYPDLEIRILKNRAVSSLRHGLGCWVFSANVNAVLQSVLSHKQSPHFTTASVLTRTTIFKTKKKSHEERLWERLRCPGHH